MFIFVKPYIKYLLFISLFLSKIFPVGEFIENAVIIVGNNRTAGLMLKEIAPIVKQSEADFTYENIPFFQEKRVISIDTEPCVTDNEHIQADFITTQVFASASQDTVIFEWFPPASKDTVTNPKATHFTTEALKKAFAILKPGGCLLIDNHPFFALTGANEIATQIHNPFALILGIDEYAKIQAAIGDPHYKPERGVTFYSEEAFLNSLKLVGTIFKQDETTIRNTLKSLTDAAYNHLVAHAINNLLETILQSPQGYMFLWGYHAYARATLMKKCLEKIGFDISGAQVEFVEENPFNKRKWACLIRAVKPVNNANLLVN